MTTGAIQYIEIPVKDLDRDATFYETVFGWKFQRDGTYFMFQDPTGNVGGGMYVVPDQPVTGGPRIYITVDSIDQTLGAIEAAGGARADAKTLIDENVGWWAGFRDPAGNTLYLYEAAHAHPH